MEPQIQPVPGYYVWESPGESTTVHIRLEVVDRMNNDVMRGFASVPKRGAEVGGLLFGQIETGDKTLIRIEEFEAVETAYRRGPSYLLADDEQAKLVEAATRERGSLIAVGYYRSHTRDGALAVGPEDIEAVNATQKAPVSVALLIKPFATKVSQATFFVRQGTSFQAQIPQEFPFRRREMTGEEPPPRRSLQERQERPDRPRRSRSTLVPDAEDLEDAPRDADEEDHRPAPAPFLGEVPRSEPQVVAPARSSRWWFPLSFSFLILGTLLGFQAALTFAPELRERTGPAAFALDLSAGRVGENLNIRWDKDSPALLAAQRGELQIIDGESNDKTLQLDKSRLLEGSVVYQNLNPQVTVRFTLHIDGGISVNESVDWRQ
jgi:hypothetical protein